MSSYLQLILKIERLYNSMKESKIIKLYRMERKLYLYNIPVLPKLISRIIRVFFSAEIPYTCNLAEGVQLMHGGLGVVIHDNAQIGSNTIIYQNVTIGGREGRGYPTIGRNVYIGVGACILGGVHIEDNAKIGANAVVIHDISEGDSVGGVPAKSLIRN